MAEHLEILWPCFRWDRRVSQAGCKACALDRHLPDTVDLRWRRDAEQVQKRRCQVASVGKLVAKLATGGDSLQPADNERIANTAPVRVLLVAPQRRVGRHSPAARVIRMRFGAADFVDACEFLREGLGPEVSRTGGVDVAERTALLAGAIVGSNEDDCIREHACLLKESYEAAQVPIGMVEHGSISRLQAGEETL